MGEDRSLVSNLSLKGEVVDMADVHCPECFRMFVEIYENGEYRCGKCGFNLTYDEYEPFELIDEVDDIDWI